NMKDDASVVHDSGILEYSRIHKMTIQAWSPFQYGFFEGAFIGNEKFPALNAKLRELADKYDATPTGIAIAWVSTHPAAMQSIIGTMTPRRIQEVTAASDITLSRPDWYDLYRSAGNTLP
ncbi:MAG: aldo/keto reductase, partial [Kiritimatiellaeota bacterium]|nr:aldo/keto reductase [Kiritimatiellota bacterium]